MFDARRFRRLATAQWMERRREWGWFIGVLVAIHFVLLVISFMGHPGYADLNLEGQQGFYWVGLYLTAPVFAARYFLPLSRRDAGLTVLMRPGSRLEKFLLALVVTALAYPLAYSLAFYVCDLPAALLAKSQALEAWAKLDAEARANASNLDPAKFGVLAPKLGLGLVDSAFWLLFLWQVVGWTVFGTLQFRSSPLVKTFVAGFVLFLGLMLLSSWSGGEPDRLFSFWKPNSRLELWQRLLCATAWIVVPVTAWTACYLALREREAT